MNKLKQIFKKSLPYLLATTICLQPFINSCGYIDRITKRYNHYIKVNIQTEGKINTSKNNKSTKNIDTKIKDDKQKTNYQINYESNHYTTANLNSDIFDIESYNKIIKNQILGDNDFDEKRLEMKIQDNENNYNDKNEYYKDNKYFAHNKNIKTIIIPENELIKTNKRLPKKKTPDSNSKLKKEKKKDIIKKLNIEDIIKDQPNKNFSVPILMYHEIGDKNDTPYSGRYVVSADVFRKHLLWLKNNDYKLISLDDYVSGQYKIELIDNKKPVIITFDDSTVGQFRYLVNRKVHNIKGQHDTQTIDKEKKIIDPNCAVSIMKQFYETYPEFGLEATFFIDYVDKSGSFEVPFGQSGYEKDKIKEIIRLGMDIGNHTLQHINIGKSNKKTIKNNIEFLDYIVNLIEPNYKIKTAAFPYGALPKTQLNKNILTQKYDFLIAAWGGVAKDPSSKSYNPYKIPRIEINDDYKNLITYLK